MIYFWRNEQKKDNNFTKDKTLWFAFINYCLSVGNSPGQVLTEITPLMSKTENINMQICTVVTNIQGMQIHVF